MNGWKDSNLKFQFNDESERSKVRRATQVITKLHEFTQILKLIYTMFLGLGIFDFKIEKLNSQDLSKMPPCTLLPKRIKLCVRQ